MSKNPKPRRITILSLLAIVPAIALLANLPAATAAELSPGVNLFFVKRSLNDNEVHYDAVVDTRDCGWKHPYVDSYWRDLKKGDHVYNEILPLLEPRVYGFSVSDPVDETIEIRLRPLESAKIDRPIKARLAPTETGCRVTTTIAIDGAQAEFQSAYIEVSGFLNLSYDYFDILGFRQGKKGSPLDADRVYERFKKHEDENFPGKPPASRWQSGVVERGLEMGRPPRE